MKSIWNWTLSPDIIIGMPIGAKVLTVQEQHGEAQLWALVDPTIPTTKLRRFRTYETGSSMPDNPGEYVGTFQECGGALIFHVFECEV